MEILISHLMHTFARVWQIRIQLALHRKGFRLLWTCTQTGQVQHALLKLIYVHKYVGKILSQLVSSDSQA